MRRGSSFAAEGRWAVRANLPTRGRFVAKYELFRPFNIPLSVLFGKMPSENIKICLDSVLTNTVVWLTVRTPCENS